MLNIITFILIILFFFIVFSIFDRGFKKSIKLIFIISFVLIITFFYYYLPVKPKFINDKNIYCEFEFNDLSLWKSKYSISSNDNKIVLKFLKDLEYKRVLNGTNSYIADNNYIINMHIKDNYKKRYTVVISKKNYNGKILVSDSYKAYSFNFNKKELKNIEDIFDEYKELASSNNKKIISNIINKEISEKYTNYSIKFDGNFEDIVIDERIIFYDYGTDSSLVSRNTKINNKNIFEVKVYNKRKVKKVKIIFRGRILLNGKYNKFQKIIEI